jgi:putative transcriptional regulator
MPAPSLKGRLLVATPLLGDPNFERTVVLLLEHGEEGAAGVVLNRPTEMELEGHLPDWEDRAATPGVVFVGGPVQPTGVICLAERGGEVEPLDPTLAPEDVSAPGVERVRVFAGYAGWGPGQLEAEIMEGAWFVVDAVPGDAMSGRPDDLWRAVLRRQPGRLRFFAWYPEDLRAN